MIASRRERKEVILGSVDIDCCLTVYRVYKLKLKIHSVCLTGYFLSSTEAGFIVAMRVYTSYTASEMAKKVPVMLLVDVHKA